VRVPRGVRTIVDLLGVSPVVHHGTVIYQGPGGPFNKQPFVPMWKRPNSA
jgi:hypothetical protein